MSRVEFRECDECGQPLDDGYFGDLCPQCQQEEDAQQAEWQQERLLETALACKCGAYGISKTTHRPYHCADCVCGAD